MCPLSGDGVIPHARKVAAHPQLTWGREPLHSWVWCSGNYEVSWVPTTIHYLCISLCIFPLFDQLVIAHIWGLRRHELNLNLFNFKIIFRAHNNNDILFNKNQKYLLGHVVEINDFYRSWPCMSWTMLSAIVLHTFVLRVIEFYFIVLSHFPRNLKNTGILMQKIFYSDFQFRSPWQRCIIRH